MAEIREVIARLQNGSLLICEGLDGHDGCGGQGYTDGGATCCVFCLGTGLATPELASAVRDEKKFRNFTVEFIGLVDDIWEGDDVDLQALRGLADTARARLRSLFDEPASTRKTAALSTAPVARPGDEVGLPALPEGWTYVRMPNGEIRVQHPPGFVATPYAAAPAADGGRA